MVPLPDGPALAHYTQQTMQNDGLVDFAPPKLFAGNSPIKHVIYIIKENRTYDQVFGDVKTSGDGHAADGEPEFAIFGSGAAAQRPDGTPQVVTPNHHALAQRFGLFDRFFVNRSEEHTSELQSQSNLVCRLLLEKKKRDKRSRSFRHGGDHSPHR